MSPSAGAIEGGDADAVEARLRSMFYGTKLVGDSDEPIAATTNTPQDEPLPKPASDDATSEPPISIYSRERLAAGEVDVSDYFD